MNRGTAQTQFLKVQRRGTNLSTPAPESTCHQHRSQVLNSSGDSTSPGTHFSNLFPYKNAFFRSNYPFLESETDWIGPRHCQSCIWALQNRKQLCVIYQLLSQLWLWTAIGPKFIVLPVLPPIGAASTQATSCTEAQGWFHLAKLPCETQEASNTFPHSGHISTASFPALQPMCLAKSNSNGSIHC